jgi:hypothetical protein
MSKRAIVSIVGVAALAGGFLLFRPDKLFVSETVAESFPASTAAESAPKAIYSGRFHGVAHDGRGVATVYQLPGGGRVLRLTEFETSNGPQLRLYFVAAPDAGDSDTVKKAGFVSLGPLKGNQGDQNYELPADLDLAKYQAVTVWCERFGVNFTTAPLATQ